MTFVYLWMVLIAVLLLAISVWIKRIAKILVVIWSEQVKIFFLEQMPGTNSDELIALVEPYIKANLKYIAQDLGEWFMLKNRGEK